MYEGCVESLVMSAFEGFNATVLAYGQTGEARQTNRDKQRLPFSAQHPQRKPLQAVGKLSLWALGYAARVAEVHILQNLELDETACAVKDRE